MSMADTSVRELAANRLFRSPQVNACISDSERAANLHRDVMKGTFLNAGMRIDLEELKSERVRLEDLVEEEERRSLGVKVAYEDAKKDFSESKTELKELKKRAETEAALGESYMCGTPAPNIDTSVPNVAQLRRRF